MNHLEKVVADGFASLAGGEVAYCGMMPVPMVPAGHYGTGMLFRPSGVAPFDVYGYLGACASRLGRAGTFVGCELKETAHPETSLQIRGAGKSAGKSGLQVHQLEALANVARCGGIARLVWCNAGAYGVIGGADLLAAHEVYAQHMGSDHPPKGTRSIPWDAFRPLRFAILCKGTLPALDWLEVTSPQP